MFDHPEIVTTSPSQATVTESGDSYQPEPPPGNIGGTNNEQPRVTDLPRPVTRPIGEPTTDPFEYDLIQLLDLIAYSQKKTAEALACISLAADESIKRRMRGPLRDHSQFGADGTATIVLGPVPSGEIWLIDRYIVVSDNGLPTATLNCFVYDGAITDPTSQIDFTTIGNNNVSDNAQPVLLFPNNSLTFYWTGGTPGANVYARANYRSIALNVQLAAGVVTE